MKKALLKVAVMLLCLAGVTPAMAQFNLKKAVGGAVKAAKAVTLTDEQMTEYVKEYIDWMDKHNQVCADDDPYTVRLKKLTEGLTEVEGMPLNFKVYYVIDVNAFACADGSVRVFSSLMDIMTDEELLGGRSCGTQRLKERFPYRIADIGIERWYFITRRKSGCSDRFPVG